MMQIPPQARDGLMRAWIAILTKRHPEHIWIPACDVIDRASTPRKRGGDASRDGNGPRYRASGNGDDRGAIERWSQS
jgi:hypothetical protein